MKIASIIMAAGKGTRMKSNLAKVLHLVHGKSLIEYVIEQAKSIQSNPIIIIIGHQATQVKKATKHTNVIYVNQYKQCGTGHAIQQAESALYNFFGDVLVLSGDVPLLTSVTLNRVICLHQSTHAAATILTTNLDDPTGYGRIVRDCDGNVISIVEHKDADTKILEIKEINTGIYLFNKEKLFSALKNVRNDNTQNEYYLPDVIPMFLANSNIVMAYKTSNFNETRGINTKEHLSAAENYLASMGY